ncbi:50S ribosomal protein L1 [Buchnera aphidicola]|uniref:Large ribosomal subunit protein uL1 n=1 Tax=Buchnera aphidicola (Sarucallis kahawaluokalani) TaxID=1241878 RepID=A0A4D6YHN2_9GAMM|nr:50S ribosomal protein L1 [Buchnera aphidicola]QCI25841.1 50S ribosomal protein L1 [Buchnera aphidicola (Sarucallis kahawaluokalani)]
MKKITKKKEIKNKINLNKEYSLEEAIEILKKYQKKNFIESVDISIHVNIDPKKTEQNIRGTTVLPHGLGKKIKIVVFTQGSNIQIAKENGADLVGGIEIAEILKNKKNKYDVVIASPDTMHIVSTLGPILGPKGLMPNPKTGTITENIESAVKKFKKGNIRYKNDKYGIIHTSIGKINFQKNYIQENFTALMYDIKKNKPTTTKGQFIQKIFLSTTMGCGIMIALNSIL